MSDGNSKDGKSKDATTALWLLFGAYTLSITDRMILSVLFEPIRLEFNVTDTQLGLLGGLSFALFYATLGIPIARIADRGDRRMIIVVSLALFSLMTVLCGFAVSFAMLVLMRIGVGIGEAGVNPASQSILADYYPSERRASAMSVLALGANAGMIIGFLFGGAISEAYGWRTALVAVGLPGILLAAVMFRKLQEPVRGALDAPEPADEKRQMPTISQTASFMFKDSAMRHLLAASTLSGTVSYGLSTWLPTFFVRLHDLTQSQVGLLMALVFGVIGALGTFTGGKLVDILTRRGLHHGVWMIAATQAVSVPFAVMAYLSGPLPVAIAYFVVPVFVGTFYLGPTLSLIQTLAPVRMRAVAAAIKMMCLNLVGLSLGPLVVGGLSDALNAHYGESSLRIALAITTSFSFWSALHFWLCGRALASRRSRLNRQTPSTSSPA